MTDDGEAPDAGGDRDDEERASGGDGDESTPTAEPGGDSEETDQSPEETVRDSEEPERDDGGETADDEPAEPSSPSDDGASGPDADSDRSEPSDPSRGNEEDPGARREESRPGESSDEGEDGPGEEPETSRTRFGSGRDHGDRRHADDERDRDAADVDAESGPTDRGESIDASEQGPGDESGSVEESRARADDEMGDEAPEGDDVTGGGETPEDGDVTAAGGVAATSDATSRDDRERVSDDREGGIDDREHGNDAPGSEVHRAEDAHDVAGDVEGQSRVDDAGGSGVAAEPDVPEDVRSYDRFQKVDRASYDRVNEFLRDRTYVTAREWAIARLCADFRTATGVEMTKIGENLPHLVPFMTDTYSPQAVNQARSAFEDKVRKSGATFLYGAMSGFFTADELDDIMYEVTEVAKFLLEVEGVELTVDEELDAEDRISAVMREVRQASEELRYDEVACPHCGEAFQPAED